MRALRPGDVVTCVNDANIHKFRWHFPRGYPVVGRRYTVAAVRSGCLNLVEAPAQASPDDPSPRFLSAERFVLRQDAQTFED